MTVTIQLLTPSVSAYNKMTLTHINHKGRGRGKQMNAANRITILRLFFVPLFICLILIPSPSYVLVSLIVFILAMLTDILDGYIARKKELVSNFGIFLDPIVDKILIISAFICFVQLQLIPAWVVIVLIFREFAITGLRIIAAAQNQNIPASLLGKLKTFTQTIAVCFMLFCYTMQLSGKGDLYVHIGFWLILVSVLASVISGVDYFLKNIKFLKKDW